MDKRLVYSKVKRFNNSFKKEDYKKIPCAEGESNLNESGEKTFEFNYKHMLAFLHLSLIMAVFEITDTGDEVTLENDFFPATNSSAKLMFGTEEIENISSCPGEASTIFQSIVTSDFYKRIYGMLSGWSPDRTDGTGVVKADKENKGFIARKNFYNGKSQVKIFHPLRYLFGSILNDYPKVFYKVPNITLILNRESDDTLSKKIFFGSKLKQAGTPAVDVLLKIVTMKLEWWIPVLTPNLTAEKFFHTQLDNDKNVEVGFMKHRMAKTTFKTEDFTWTIAEVRKHISG